MDLPTLVRELRAGDIVQAHGMILRVCHDPIRSESHGADHGGVWYARAAVQNRADVPRERVPYSFTADRYGHYWSLQGNDLARVFAFVSRPTTEG